MFKLIIGKSFATMSFACAAAVLLFAGLFAPATFAADFVKQDLNYTDSLDSLANPESGFYDAQVTKFYPDGSKNCGDGYVCHTWGKIFQMRVDISRFSDNGCFKIDDRCETQRFSSDNKASNGMTVADSCKQAVQAKQNEDPNFCKSQPFTEAFLSTIREFFQEARDENRSLIVRLAYDSWYDGHQNGEPDQELIRTHLRQIGPLYSEFSDVIVFVEVGLYGRWGEQNGSKQGTNVVIADAMQTILESTNSEIKTGPRRPDIIAAWNGIGNSQGYADFEMDNPMAQAAFASKGDNIYRVGIYNDGYLGNCGDMGTVGMGWPNGLRREAMLQYLETYAHHVPYGGELVYNSNESRGPINSPRYLSYEGFRSHTSYLNRYHHKATIDAWVDSTFDGEHDPEYIGHNGFVYVRNHLGYRYILRESNVMDSVGIGGKFKANLKIENVGFGSMTQRRKVTLVFKQGSTVREIVPSEAFDPWDLLSRPVSLNATDAEIETYKGSVPIMQFAEYGSGLHEVSIEATVPEDLPQGEWDVYVRISRNANYPADSNYQTVRFGNPVSQFDSTTGSNYIGKFVLSDKVPVEEDDDAIASRHNLTGIRMMVEGSALYVRGAREVEVFDLNGNLILAKGGLDASRENRIEGSALEKNRGVLIVRGKNALGQTAIQKVRLAR